MKNYRINTGNVIKAIIAIKAVFLLVVFISSQASIGEKPLNAQDKPAPEKIENTANEETTDEDVVVKRKSYLDDLLNLPKIDTGDLKRDEISRYLNVLTKKKKQVENRVKLLAARERNLVKLEKSIDQKLEKLQEELDFFQTTLQKEKEINQDRLGKLVEFYKKMTPKKAAPVFEKMDKDLVVSLFNKIPKKQTMNILSLMTPDRSVEISEYYGRIRSGKEYEMLKQVNLALKKEFQQCKGLPNEEK